MITGSKEYVLYMSRVRQREFTVGSATMNFVGYFMSLGDDKTTSEGKVTAVSTEVAALLYVYTLGNTQPLKDAINAIDDTVLTYMTAEAKAFLVGQLTPTT